MKPKYHSIVLFVKDIETSKAFYLKYFDLKIKDDFGKNVGFDNGLTLWEIRKSHELNAYYQPESPDKAFELYFESPDIKTFSERVVSEGIKLVHEVKEEPWGQLTIRFFDPDGHIIEVGEPLKVFVGRMKNEGMDINAIHRKTGIPEKQIEKLIK